LCVECGQAHCAEIRFTVPDGPGEPPAPPKRWVLVIEVSEGEPPTSVRVKKIIKYGLYQGAKVVAFPCDLPEGTRTDQAIEEPGE
jgi:hypothetical protein